MKWHAITLTLLLCFAGSPMRGQNLSKPEQNANQNRFPQFPNVTERAGVHFRTETSSTSQKYLLETMGGGVAIFDYDGDGWMDIFFVNGAQLSDPMRAGEQPNKTDPRYWNRLYHNNHDGTFTDVTEKAGLQGCCYGMGV